MTENQLEAFHCQLYHQWCNKDMKKQYSDKRRKDGDVE